METVVVAIIVGAFSGLLGSIAGPFLAHGLDRRRRSELRQEERNLELRRMLEVVMRLARTVHSTTLEIELLGTLGGNFENVLQRHDQYTMRLESLHPDFAWRPHRIHDATLRRLAIGLISAQSQLHMLVGALRGIPLASTENWFQQVQNVRPWVDGLMEAVDQRMDELGW